MSSSQGRLDGKIVMVTGGGSGIGRAICVLFAREGARITVVDVNENAAQETLKALRHGDHCSIKADVTKAEDVKRAFAITEEKCGGKCDIVVNNAGILGKQNFVSDISEEDFDRVVDVNLKGVFLVAKEFINSVKTVEKDVRGVLINMSSLAGKIGFIGNAEYAATKGAVASLRKSIAGEFMIHKVRCNAVQPGFIDTPMLKLCDFDILNKMSQMIPMARNGTPEEIAYGFLYLASEESSYVHGACLEISGGLGM